MSVALLSQHSSNPLEVNSSDPIRLKYSRLAQELSDSGDEVIHGSLRTVRHGDVEDGEDQDDGADADGQGETDEEMSIMFKSQEEREEIEDEIAELEELVPGLSASYKILDRLGTGTFSSVYKALDLDYHKFDNSPWQGSHLRNDSKVFVAVKKIYATSSPERIRNEIAIMQDCRGCRNVSQIITAFRHEDQVVAVMPYHRNMDFRVRFVLLSSPYQAC
jgi:cell division control protein 7